MEARWHTRYRGGEKLLEWVADNAALTTAVAQFEDRVALDTEFIRTHTYYPMPGLYQVASGDRVFLLDPLGIDDWQPLIEYLRDPHTTKIMHACLEDLELLHNHLGVSPRNVFDTQYANAFLSPDFSLSYAALVERLLGISLEKHETRSNWLQRPLSDEQIRYAIDDVTHLLRLYQSLSDDLESLGRSAWFGADMRDRSEYQVSEPTLYYRNVKKAWQLSDQQLAVLQTLCAWREDTARSENVPRNRVIWDEHLFGFARIDALSTEHVRQALPNGVARRYAQPLVDQHRVGRDAQAPEPLPRPLTPAQGAVLKALRNVARETAVNLNLAPELLARKRDLEYCVRHHAQRAELSPHYGDWRGELVADPFMDILQPLR